MAIAHRRGFRTLISRKYASSYANLDDDNDQKKSFVGKSNSKSKKASSVISVRTAASTDDEASRSTGVESESINANDKKVIVCIKEGQDEDVPKKRSFPENFLESTRHMAVEMVHRTSTMTSIVAKTLASNSVVNEWDGANEEETKEENDSPNREETGEAQQQGEHKERQKTPQHPNGIDLEQEVGKRLEEAFSCGSDMVETSKECVDSAYQKTNKVALDLIDTSTCMGREVMASTEQCTQAAIVDKLPLTPLLEQSSERLEQACESFVVELQDFLTDHWELLQKTISSKRGKGWIGNVRATDDTVLNVSIEVQMKASE